MVGPANAGYAVGILGPGLPPHASPDVASWPDPVEAEYTIVEPPGHTPASRKTHRNHLHQPARRTGHAISRPQRA